MLCCKLHYRVAFSVITALLLSVSIPNITVMAQDGAAGGGEAAGNEKESKPVSKTEMSAFLGTSQGQQLSRNGIVAKDIEEGPFMAALLAALNDKEPSMSRERLIATQTALQKLVAKRMAEKFEAYKAEGDKFLAENSKKDGVKKLNGGLQYKVLKSGKGKTPEATDTVTVHYTGKFINGQTFDSSVKRGEPAKFRVGGVIKGWQIALTNMKVGDKWMVYIPSELAYGPNPNPQSGMPPNAVLIFEVELLAIQ